MERDLNDIVKEHAENTPPATPAPWRVGVYHATEAFRAIDEHVCVYRADGTVLAVCGPFIDHQSHADARLMADAPRLRERLSDVLHAADELLLACQHPDWDRWWQSGDDRARRPFQQLLALTQPPAAMPTPPPAALAYPDPFAED